MLLVFVSALQEEGDTAQSVGQNTRLVLIYPHAMKSAKTMIAYFEPVATRERPVSEGGARENPSLSPQQRSNGTLPLLLLLLLQQKPFKPPSLQPRCTFNHNHKHRGWAHMSTREVTWITPRLHLLKKKKKKKKKRATKSGARRSRGELRLRSRHRCTRNTAPNTTNNTHNNGPRSPASTLERQTSRRV